MAADPTSGCTSANVGTACAVGLREAPGDDAAERLPGDDAAERLDDLRVPPGNRLEKLVGNRAGQHGIRINEQWRACFVWREGHAYDVESVDYH